MPSVLDRLTDPESTSGSGQARGYTPQQMMDAVRRDLEELLNSHETTEAIPSGYPEVRSSIVAYGLPDMTSLAVLAAARNETIGRIIERIVARHEPRLRDVRVMVAEKPGEAASTRLRFQIEARLNVDPSPEVEFETILELTTGQALIRQGTG